MSILNKFSNYLSVSIFVQRAYREFDNLSKDEYFLRKGEGTKKLIEEILPLTAFLKWFERPGRRVKCRYYAGNQNFDAKIKLSGPEVELGFIPDHFFIEVTSPEEERLESLRRESLARYGIVFSGRNIKRIRERKKGIDCIVSEPMVVDSDYPVKNSIELIRNVLAKKSQKKYPVPCILLVQVTPDRSLSIPEWLQIICAIRGDFNQEKFHSLYLVNWGTNDVFKV